MRIAYVVPRCVPENSHGRYTLGIAKVVGRRHQVHIISAAFPPDEILPATIQRVPLPNWPALGRLASWWAVAPLLIRQERFDIVHTLGADAPVGTVITAFCSNRGIRLALRAAGVVDLGRPHASWYSRLMSPIAEAADRLCFSRPHVKRVVVPSRHVGLELESLCGVSPGIIRLVPEGVDLEAFSPAARNAWRAGAREKFGVEPDELVCAYVGGAYRLKGLLTLFSALRELRDPKLRVLVVGVTRNDELAREEENGLRGRVIFAGNIRSILDMYAAADMFVLPTLYDGFGLASLEAMACGLPVIISCAAGISDLLTDTVDALVLKHPTDAAGIAHAVSALRGSGTLRHEMGLRARTTAERYSWAAIGDRIFQVYEEVAG